MELKNKTFDDYGLVEHWKLISAIIVSQFFKKLYPF